MREVHSRTVGAELKQLVIGLTFGVVILSLLTACAGRQVRSTAEHRSISLEPRALHSQGIAFITPSTITGQEQDKQTLAFIFAEVLVKERPNIPCVTLAETLSSINRAGLTDEYKLMYQDYQNTGLFRREKLKEVGETTGARYLAQLKLAGFEQASTGRWSILGVRMTETKRASIRLFFQLWDTADGTIAWEGVQELTYAHDTVRENPITFRTVVEESARSLVSRLP